MKKLRIAILTDIHGNSIALDAVLDDIQAQGGVDEYWFLGDFVAIGPEPVEVLKRLVTLPEARFIRGNTDRYVVSGERPGPSLEAAREDTSLLPLVTRLASSFSWTAGAISVSGWLPWLEDLPMEMRTRLPDGTTVLAVHASPGTDDGNGIHPGTGDEELRQMVSGLGVNLILVGHTHSHFDRWIDNVRVVNPGSTSNTFPPDLRANYLLMTCEQEGYTFEHRRVEFDREAVIEATKRVKHPAGDHIVRFLRGEIKSPWSKE